MRICIYGAGSVGGFIGGMLAQGGYAVSLVATRERWSRGGMESRGGMG
jgi:ketopantoate reductase